MEEKIVGIIKNKFIENLDEGLFLRQDINEFELSDEQKDILRMDSRNSFRDAIVIPDKQNPKFYLSKIILKTMICKDDPTFKSYITYDSYFNIHFNKYWSEKAKILEDILLNAPQFISAESISEDDFVFVNVGYRDWIWENKGGYSEKINNTFTVINNNQRSLYIKKADCKKSRETYTDIYIISRKYFIKLSLGSKGVIDRTEHIIQRDIKKINIAENIMLEVFFHGHFDPETIILDDYKTALNLQRHLTELRQVRTDSYNKNKFNKQ